MTKTTKKILIGVGIFIIVCFIPGCWTVSTNIDTDNTEVDLRTAITAKTSDQEATYDNMWKILQQKAQVTDEYKAAFDTIYTNIIQGRYENDQASFMKWIQEDNPKFDASLYADLMNSITIERNAFLTVERQLMDLKKAHDDLRQKWPSRWFINDDVSEISITIISSTRSKDAMKTGIDDDTQLFKP